MIDVSIVVVKKKNLILAVCQVDDILFGCSSGEIAKSITNQICKKVKFEHKDTLPITFIGLAKDYNGVGVEQYSDCICVSAQIYIERLLKTHNWDTKSSKETASTETGKPIAPLSLSRLS